jgi:hypothetical protein
MQEVICFILESDKLKGVTRMSPRSHDQYTAIARATSSWWLSCPNLSFSNMFQIAWAVFPALVMCHSVHHH